LVVGDKALEGLADHRPCPIRAHHEARAKQPCGSRGAAGYFEREPSAVASFDASHGVPREDLDVAVLADGIF
jgi:hypothetical protein